MLMESNSSEPVSVRHVEAKGAVVPVSDVSITKELASTRQQHAREKAIRLVGPLATEKMNHKMKGLLKGLRYISQIFDSEDEKEHEMVIGYPTDVKHVAHIGLDGPSNSNNTPSWMNGFKSPANLSSAPLSPATAMKELVGPNSASQDLQSLMQAEITSARGSQGAPRHARLHQSSGGAPADSSPQDSPDVQKPRSRHHTSGAPSGSPNHESSEGSVRRSRRRATQGSSAVDSPSRDSAGVPRQSRPRRPKGSSGGSTEGSESKDSRAKASSTLTEPEPSKTSQENQPTEGEDVVR